ncbi:hypothetical protein ACHOLT_17500 [Desulfitobacterium sp. Sab5]|uniref:hypothetical protein n=1 Tax=Desulfitobacterium nosdiversum TaxID=3375356 RepID=UPI003CF7A7F2
MKLYELLWTNIKLFSAVLLAFILGQLIAGLWRRLYIEMKYRFEKSKIGNVLLEDILKKVIPVILPLILLVVLVALQQKYSFINFGKSEGYTGLVIGILTLYGILYVFLQFIINYTLQDRENDLYWGRSITQELLVQTLGYKFFGSAFFRLLLVYGVIYPYTSETIISVTEKLSITESSLQALWETSLFAIFILYIYLFLQSLSGMNILYDVHKKSRLMYLRWRIEERVTEEYMEKFKYAYKKNRYEFFFNPLFAETEDLKANEQQEMIMHILSEMFTGTEFTPGGWSMLERFTGDEENEQQNRLIYLYQFFIELFERLAKSSVHLKIDGLLKIYRIQDVAICKAIDSFIKTQNEKSESRDNIFIDELVDRYTQEKFGNKECTYFKLPVNIIMSITSWDDIEEIHKHITWQRGYKIIQKIRQENDGELTNSQRLLLGSYDAYLKKMLDHYKDYVDVLKGKSDFWFFGSLKRGAARENSLSNAIYLYMRDMAYTESDKEYFVFLAERLDYKYKAALVIYHMLYPISEHRWSKEVKLFRRIIDAGWADESIADEEVLEFVCTKIAESNIEHRIEGDLIRWIGHHIKIRQVNEKIMHRCLTDRYITYAKLLKLIYIFTDNASYPVNFYNFDFDKIEKPSGSNWGAEFLTEMLETPELLWERFFAKHVYQLCEKISYSDDDFARIRDFRVFWLNPIFNLDKSKFMELTKNHYLEKGIIEFLLLRLSTESYEYLIQGETSASFAARVKAIIKSENKEINKYVETLVSRANECRGPAISDWEVTRLINELQKLLDK